MKTSKTWMWLGIAAACLMWAGASIATAQEAGAPPPPPDAAGGPPMFDPSAMFDRLDTNKDGSITKEEFTAGAQMRRGGRDTAGERGDRRGQRPGDSAAGDMAQRFREEMMNRMKTELGCTDEEWAILQPRIEKVMELQRALRGGPAMRMGGRGGPGASDAPATPEADALRKALENKQAPVDEVQKKLEAFRAAKKKQAAELDAARAALREVLTARQEAAMVLAGILE